MGIGDTSMLLLPLTLPARLLTSAAAEGTFDSSLRPDWRLEVGVPLTDGPVLPLLVLPFMLALALLTTLTEVEGALMGFFLCMRLAGATPLFLRMHMAHRHSPRHDGHFQLLSDDWPVGGSTVSPPEYSRPMHDWQNFLLQRLPDDGALQQKYSSLDSLCVLQWWQLMPPPRLGGTCGE